MNRFCLFVFLLISIPAFAKTNIVMVFGVEYPPFYYEKQSSGMFIEFLNGFNESNPDYEISIVPLSRRRIDQWIAEGKADAFSLAHEAFVPEVVREKFLASDILWETSDRLVSSSLSPKGFSQLSDLNGMRIGTLIGNGYMALDPMFSNDIIMRFDFYSIKGQLDAVLAQNIPSVIINEHGLNHYMALYGIKPESLYIHPQPLYRFGLSTMISKKKPHFYRAFNQYVRDAKRSGMLAMLEKKYKFTSLEFNNNSISQ